MPRSSREAAERTREAILSEVVSEASIAGLDGITIGTLAERLRMSKAGVVGPFGSKERLQLEALDRAAAIFRAEVWDPAAGAEPVGLSASGLNLQALLFVQMPTVTPWGPTALNLLSQSEGPFSHS